MAQSKVDFSTTVIGPVIKRSYIEDESESELSSNRVKIRAIDCIYTNTSSKPLILINLPHELLTQIFSYLELQDVIHLSLANHSYHEELKKYTFKRIKLRWDLLETLHEFAYLGYINELRIVDSYSYGDWYIDIGKYLGLIPNLECVEITSVNSSNWLKYRTNSKITKMVLIHDIVEAQKKKFLNIVFNLNHIERFDNIRILELYDYHFNWPLEETSAICLRELKIINCTWEYPFNLEQFGKRTLNKLSIVYRNNHSFNLSERFGLFIKTPFTFDDLKYLEISLEDYDLYPNLNLELNEKQLGSTLEHVKLHGWRMTNYGVFNKFDMNLKKLDLKIRSDDYTAEQLKSKVVELIGGRKLQLSVSIGCLV